MQNNRWVIHSDSAKIPKRNEIQKQIDWYEENAKTKEEEIIKANLKMIDQLYAQIEDGEDSIYFDKIIAAFCEIMEMLRKLMENADSGAILPEAEHWIKRAKAANLRDDRVLHEFFTAYFMEKGRSSYTANDYCSRIKNLWFTFFEEYIEDRLPMDLSKETMAINEELLEPQMPMWNVFVHIDLLRNYIYKKILIDPQNRNLANARAALNKYSDFCAILKKQ